MNTKKGIKLCLLSSLSFSRAGTHSTAEVRGHLWRSPSPVSLLRAGQAKAYCLGPCPFWCWISPRKRLHHLSGQHFL